MATMMLPSSPEDSKSDSATDNVGPDIVRGATKGQKNSHSLGGDGGKVTVSSILGEGVSIVSARVSDQNDGSSNSGKRKSVIDATLSESGSGSGYTGSVGDGDSGCDPNGAQIQPQDGSGLPQNPTIKKRKLNSVSKAPAEQQSQQGSRTKVTRGDHQGGQSEEEDVLQLDLDASLTTLEGQLAQNPGMTEKEAIVSAKREYNRRNAARARKRAKEQVGDLQLEAYALGMDITKLKEANERLQIQLNALKQQSAEIVRNHQSIKAGMMALTPPIRNPVVVPNTAASCPPSDPMQQILAMAQRAALVLQGNMTQPPIQQQQQQQQQQQPANQIQQMLAAALPTAFQQPTRQNQPQNNHLGLLMALAGGASDNSNNANIANNSNSNTPANTLFLQAIQNVLQQQPQNSAQQPDPNN